MSEVLDKNEIEHFVHNGFVRVDRAFAPELAEAALEILWNDLPFNRSDPNTWTEPVVRLGMYTDPPFVNSVNTPRLHSAFNQLIGAGRWQPCMSVGTFPVRFPSERQPSDTGPHVDAGFPGDDPADYFKWRVNVKSKGRALLMLVLYSDVNERDAPTIIYKSSHLDIARMLYPAGDAGLSFSEIADRLGTQPPWEEVYATGKAGTVYLCHPFMVHAAQAHRGKVPKFMAQPPLLLRGELTISGPDADCMPVEQAIRLALE